MRYNDSLHESVVVLAVITEDRPHVPVADRGQMRYGFNDAPHLGKDLVKLSLDDVTFDPRDTSYLLGRERIEVDNNPGMARWCDRLFILLNRNAADPSAHFDLPIDRSLDIGTHVSI